MMDQQCALCSISERLPPNTGPTLADFKHIPPFCGPLVEVKEALIMIDRAIQYQLDLLNGPLTCALALFVANFVASISTLSLITKSFNVKHLIIT